MATKIVTKSGSGAPATTDLVAGELAVDLTNKRLYTENGSAAIIELGTNPSGDVTFGDNGKAIFGAGSDLQIYHDGGHSRIEEVGTGDLTIRASSTLFLQSATNENYLKGVADGAVTAYYNNAAKLATTATGIDVTGDVNTSGLLKVGTNDTEYANNYLRFKPTGAAYIDHSTVGQAINFRLSNASSLDKTVMTLSSAGNVGIGTSSPSSALHVDSSNDGPIFDSGGTGNTNHALLVRDSSNNQLLRVNNNGNVGIGTSTNRLGEKLHVLGNGIVTSSAENTNMGMFGTFGGSELLIGAFNNIPVVFRQNNTERMRIDASGNVGIGTSSPTAKAHIVGAANAIALKVANSAVDGNTADVVHIEPSNGAYVGKLLRIQSGRSDFSDSLLFLNTTAGINGTNGSYMRVQNQVGADIFRIKGDGNVGIGTSSPSAKLHVDNGSGSALYVGLANNIYSRGTEHIWQSLNNASEYMRIDASGNLLVGKTASDSGTVGIEARPTGRLFATADGAYAAKFERLTSDGDIAVFTKDGATVGSIGTVGGATYYGGTTKSLRINTTGFHPATNTGAYSDDTVSLGHSGGRFKDLYLSGGVYFGGPSEINPSIAYLRSSSATTSSLTLRKSASAADGVDFFQCRNLANSIKLVIDAAGDVRNVNNSYGAESDAKLKENIIDATSQWDDIKAVRVRKYSLKEHDLDAPNMIGVVAQELEASGMSGLVSQSIDRNEDNEDLGTVTKSVAYSVLYMKSVKALQEAMERIESLESRIAALES